ncbi:GH3 family domain-containing protein [Hymenobacter humi]
MLDQLLATAVQWGSMPRLARIRRQPHEVQAELLRQLLQRAQATEWGQRYGFRERLNASEFSRRVPVGTYEQLYPEIEKVLRGQPNVLWPGRPRWFAKSSGTTNARSKYIPVTAEALQDCHYRAGRDMLALATHFYPQERLLAGKTLSLGGTHTANPFRPQDAASRAGDVSAVIMQQLPGWAEQMRTPPLKLALLDEWEEKLSASPPTSSRRTCAPWPACPPGWWCCCAAWWSWPACPTSPTCGRACGCFCTALWPSGPTASCFGS